VSELVPKLFLLSAERTLLWGPDERRLRLGKEAAHVELALLFLQGVLVRYVPGLLVLPARKQGGRPCWRPRTDHTLCTGLCCVAVATRRRGDLQVVR
jgi:hypothetical protein